LCRILERAAFVADVQQVRVHRERGLGAAGLLDRDVMFVGERQQRFTTAEVPLAPRRNDLDFGFERVGTKFEANLVVALAGCTVADCIGTRFTGDLDQTLGDQRSSDRGAEQVFAFVDGVGPKHREDEVANKLFAQVIDVDLLDTHRFRFGSSWLQLLALAKVGGEGNDFAVVLEFKPLENHRGIEATGVGQYNLRDVGFLVRHYSGAF